MTKEEVMDGIMNDQYQAARLELALRGIDDMPKWPRYPIVKASSMVGIPTKIACTMPTKKLIVEVAKKYSDFVKEVMVDPDVLAWANDYFEFLYKRPTKNLTPFKDQLRDYTKYNHKRFPEIERG